MASDGVWEFIDSPEGVNIVAQFIEVSATEACTRLIETSAAKWRQVNPNPHSNPDPNPHSNNPDPDPDPDPNQEEGDYRDDITAICVRIADVAKDMQA